MRVLSTTDLRCPLNGKHAYPTEATARDAMQLAWRRPHERRENGTMPFRVYLCECGWWHLSSREQLTKPKGVNGERC